VLWGLALGVLVLHALILSGLASPLALRLAAQPPAAPVQLRVVTPAPTAPALPKAPPPRPRPAAAPPAPAAETSAQEPALPPMPATEASAPASVPEPVLVQQPEPLPVAMPAEAPAASAPSAVAVPETTAWPLVPLGALPPSTLLSYSLTGMDKGLTYHASGELRWQHNDTAYELTLTVRAFLLGARHWRSVGSIEPTGLAPTRFSDSWRNERAAHFDREQQRVVFSSNSKPAALQAGAQDQVSLYVQLAAAMAGEPERFAPGTRLQVQTATVRDAQPWSLTLEQEDALPIDGRTLRTFKWVCQPRNQYEARVEFWVSPEQAWLPLRIRITQASGSYIDLNWRASEPLAPLPPRS
jgi:hypothetical protein